MSERHPFTNRWRVTGRLRLLTPLHVGSGATIRRPGLVNAETGAPAEVNAVAVDHEHKPYLPATALKGNLRAWLTRLFPKDDAVQPHLAPLFGSLDPGAADAAGSKLFVQDAFFHAGPPSPAAVPYWDATRRTGVLARVALDRGTRSALPERLFHTEFVPAGATFEVVIDGQNLSAAEVAVLLAGLDGFNHPHDPVRLGGEAGHDWGRCKWELTAVARVQTAEVAARISKPDPAGNLRIGFGLCEPLPAGELTTLRGDALRLYAAAAPSRWTAVTLALRFDGPVLVNDPSRCLTETDPDHFPRLTADGRGLLPASSVRGALRAQAERIVRTLNHEQAPKGDLPFRHPSEPWRLIEAMFGDAGWASAFRLTDAVTAAPVTPVRQEFVAVDRFTGGAAGSAKFNAEAIPAAEFVGTLRVDVARLREYAKGGLGLLALVLRDLREGDVPIGFGTRKGYGACRAAVTGDPATADDLAEFRQRMGVSVSDLPAVGTADQVVPAPAVQPTPAGPGEFHNPYHFVPLTADSRPADLKVNDFRNRQVGHVTHDRYLDQSAGERVYSGRLVVRLTTEGPAVFGAAQTRATPAEVAEVANYELDGKPAVPATSIKGLLSAVAEAAAGSAPRVLHGERSFSYRAAMDQSLGAIGMVVKGGDGPLKLLPLTLPHMNRQPGNAVKASVDQGLYALFTKDKNHPVPLRTYLDGYVKTMPGPKMAYATGSFLERVKPNSYSHAEQRFWRLKLAGTPTFGMQMISEGQAPCLKAKGNQILGRYPLNRQQPDLIPEDEWEKLPDAEKKLYTRGILRVLGLEGREGEMPTTKTHELFLPVPEGDVSKWQHKRLDLGDALTTFRRLARERHEPSDGDTPFHLRGADWDAIPELKPGDLVCFTLKPKDPKAALPPLDQIAISAIWRRDAGTADRYFAAVDPELLPFRPGRTQITLAEQLFGFVELREQRSRHGEKTERFVTGTGGNPVLALAGRLRLSAGRQPDAQHVKPMNAVVLKILSSPKPPSPAFYFAGRTGTGGHMAKAEFADHTQGVPRPQGRKFYVHDKTVGNRHITANPADNAKQKNRVRPLPANTGLVFHIDFDNLSETELALLCYAVRPTETFRHKLGMGKPLGLGKVKLDPVGLFLVHRTARYAADALTATRYHHGWTVEEAKGWPARYDQEQAFPAGGPSPFALRELFREGMPAAVRHALELLGDPAATTAPVMYPQLAGVPMNREEMECFRWWVSNEDRRRTKERQALWPIKPDMRSLPTLGRE